LENKNKPSNGIGNYAVMLIFSLFISSCATYYQRSQELMTAVYANNLESAEKLLQDDAKWEKKRNNLLLFYLNKGTILWMSGKYNESNVYFQKADYFVEDYNKSIGSSVISILGSPKFTTYAGENFEQIMLHYYTVINYMKLQKLDEALIEAKRMLLKMQRITDAYKSENKYKRDAFAHTLVGIVYDARKEYNDAFIAYRNAWEVYKEDYSVQLNTAIPAQLKLDILRTAYLTGFFDEVRFFEKEFGIKYSPNNNNNSGELVAFWNNGLGPVKDELSINISIIPQGNGYVQFVNYELGIAFPMYVGEEDSKGLADMRFIRMALPKYISRVSIFQQAKLRSNGTIFQFNLAQDINAIAYKSLQDRMLKELSAGILRLALKQLAVHKASQDKQKEGLALAASVLGAISEHADTRNWQLLPSDISYTRMRLDTGNQVVTFEASGENGAQVKKDINLNVKLNETLVICLQTPEFSGYQR
jgi:hypothetical protein